MEQTKYEHKVRERAEEFAALSNGVSISEFREEWHKDAVSSGFFEFARLSLQREAEAYTAGRAKGYDIGMAWSDGEPITVTPNFELQSLGLVP